MFLPMVRVTRVVVCGARGVGKTSLIEQCIHGNFNDRTASESVRSCFDMVIWRFLKLLITLR